ncbi:DUF6346 domain-containing protein [Saccharopolyspora dendranthemae]|uniref:Uncharacterized protein n=1 Tax=Saccharopolyspora dendranthemae TaxID=1181886 RepID=A0A561VBI0_9PSEU|nr:DUF6346 domain-containing protein [Saccharopolyspora dendranthemae]TWG08907.1 hypothetical protein FHU35_111536 [Saccharopolyspora dendranthemae]
MSTWNSNSIGVRLAKLVLGLLTTACILMLWPTIVFSFPEKAEKQNATALVESCKDTGPITRRGFGHNWDCAVRIRDDETGRSWTTAIDMNFFSPEDVGKEKRLTWGHGGGRASTNNETYIYTRAEGYPTGVRTLVAIVTAIIILPPALWLLAKSIVWSFSRDEQRKFWEKINGTPEERAEKKRKKQEEDAQWRETQRRRAEQHEAAKAARDRAKDQR